jgi:hypothetical protein
MILTPIPVGRIPPDIGEQMFLITAVGRLRKALEAAQGETKSDAQETLELVEDMLLANRDKASFLLPSSGEGVAFLLFSVFTGAWMMQFEHDATRRAAYARRVDRCLYAILDYFDSEMNVSIRSVGQTYYMPGAWDPRLAGDR